MSETFDMVFSDYHTLEDLNEVLKTINKYVPASPLSRGQMSRESIYLHFPKLGRQDLLNLPIFSSIKDFTVRGKFTVKPIPWDEISEIFKNMDKRIIKEGASFLRVGYEEKNSQQSRFGYDSMSVAIQNGLVKFNFRANGSLPCVDVAYGHSLIRGLISFLGFPIVVEGNETEYRMKDEKGNLKILAGGAFGENPSAFSYIIGESNNFNSIELIEILKSSLEYVGYKKLFKCSLHCGTSAAIDSSAVNTAELFDLVRSQDFPFNSYDVELKLGFPKNLNEIDVLQVYLKKNDSFSFHLTGFEIGEINYVNLYVTTTKEGHKLHAEMRLPDDYEKVVEMIGLDIEKPKWMKKAEWLKWSESKNN